MKHMFLRKLAYGIVAGIFVVESFIPFGLRVPAAQAADAPHIDSFEISKEQVVGPTNVTVSWKSRNTDSCFIMYGGISGTLESNGSFVYLIKATTTFHLECSGNGATVNNDHNITVWYQEPSSTASTSDEQQTSASSSQSAAPDPEPVQPAPRPAMTLTVTASPSVITYPNQTVQVDWEAKNADSCKHDNAPYGLNGNFAENLSESKTYRFDCYTNDGGHVWQEASVTYQPSAPKPPPVIDSFDISAIEVIGPTNVTVSWSSRNTDYCTINNGSNRRESSGSFYKTISATESFHLDCYGNGVQVTANRDLTVHYKDPQPVVHPVAVITKAYANPETVQQGSPTRISWESADAEDCVINGTVFPANSWFDDVPNQTKTYQIYCRNQYNTSETKTVTVTVVQPAPQPEPKPQDASDIGISFDISATEVVGPTSVHVSWRSENANYCVINTIRREANGSFDEIIRATTTYHIECYNNGGGRTTDRDLVVWYKDPQPKPDVVTPPPQPEPTSGSSASDEAIVPDNEELPDAKPSALQRVANVQTEYQERLVSDLKNRQAITEKSLEAYSKNEQGLLETGVQVAGQAGGFIGDTIANGIVTVGTAMLELFNMRDKAPVVWQMFLVLNPDIARGLQMVSSGQVAFDEWLADLEKTHPRTVRNIEAFFGLGDFALSTYTGSAVVESLASKTSIAEKVIWKGAWIAASEREALQQALKVITKDAVATSYTDVAAYIIKFKRLPKNFITEAEANALGWAKGKDLSKYAPGKSIGGERYWNKTNHLPDAPNRKWFEADIGYVSGKRGAQRIVYSNDGLIFGSPDHFTTEAGWFRIK